MLGGGEGANPPLGPSPRRSAPATCHTRQLPTPRIPPCGLNGTSQTRLPPCAEGSSQRSSHACHAAPAAAPQQCNVDVVIYNSVVLAWFAERGCPQANRVTLTDSCRCNNSLGDDFQHQFRLAGVVKLFEGSFESFTHRRKRLGFKLSRFYEGLD